MRKRVVSTLSVRFRGVGRALVLVVLFCFQINLLCALAQESKDLSEKPLITQVFDPARNETEVRVILNVNTISVDTAEFSLGGVPGKIYGPWKGARSQSGLVLGHASHIYEGRTPTGKQSASFTFFSKRKDTFKDQPAFSVIIEGQAIQEGVSEPPVQLASNEPYRQKIIVIVPTEVFLRIARAKKVQFKLGPKTYKTESYQQKSMRALANIIEPQSK